jgi:hypothetical protein
LSGNPLVSAIPANALSVLAEYHPIGSTVVALFHLVLVGAADRPDNFGLSFLSRFGWKSGASIAAALRQVKPDSSSLSPGVDAPDQGLTPLAIDCRPFGAKEESPEGAAVNSQRCQPGDKVLSLVTIPLQRKGHEQLQ